MARTRNSLSHLQSFDLVQREFHRWHGRELNAERTWEIVSSFVQGQEYFESAATAAEAVRPLLLYYGVLSLSRGLIIFLQNISEAALKPSHGLEMKSWRDTLAAKDRNVLDLSVSITEGTFSELASATRNGTSLLV